MIRRFLFCCLALFGSVAMAHPLAPALLELEQVSETKWDVHWRLSRRLGSSLPPEPIFPEHCQSLNQRELTPTADDAVDLHWTIQCAANGLVGDELRILGLNRSPINVVLRLRDLQGRELQTLLDVGNPAYRIPAFESAPPVWQRFLELGIEHLIFGPDHLLFLLALLLLVTGRRRIILTLTAFTLGHSVTLALASLELIAVNSRWMEVAIAITLVFVARELLAKNPGITARHPAFVAAGFGLIHGLGFAGALAEIGLPADQIFTALLSFNVGIEMAQLLIAAAFLILTHLFREFLNQPAPRVVTQMIPAYLIGTLAVVWVLERMTGLG